MTAADGIREFALPVVMISANGLICLALYNRLAAVTSRFRLFGREQFDVQIRLLELEDVVDDSRPLMLELRARLSALALHRQSLLRRAKMVRDALLLMLFAVIGMLATSLLLGIGREYLHPTLPLCTFAGSVFLMTTGVIFAVRELLFFWEHLQKEEGTLPIIKTENWADHETASAA
jgi:hypothetical protein